MFFFFPNGLKEKKKRGIAAGVVFMVRYLPDRKNKQHLVVMDNYFTLVKTTIGTRKCGVACMGTAQYRTNWSPPKMYYMNDRTGNFRMFC